ncbi:hypothetical protein L1987_56750 [Smallanthus sonchifolius]|uniref:Uncharacterized protein n=1 Tax=Smallanthus sonchifolius TaxID=185202 RepID=A0ACB9DAY4_9ASTR|nr:hypothetical protein L1987_56750 [Smallanthus sonchifolius]
MGKSQKTDPPVKAKEKNLLPDIDIDKDFLGSWKSMSMGDDGMDFDFGPTTKGKQKDFKFGKMDMDFSLDADFGKLASFKMDMSGLDISSPTKKSGKSKESSKEVSSGGVNRAEGESYAFPFDFDEFPDLGFESKKTKIHDNSNKSKDKEGYSNASSSGGSGDFLAKDVDASEDDDISLKHPASWGVTNSEVDTQMGNIKDCDPRNEGDNLKSLIDESSLQKPANSEEQETHKTIELIQESPSSEKRYSPEPLAQKVVQDSYVCSEDINVSTECTFSDVQEEESRTLARVVSSSTGDEQNDNVRPVAELVPTRKFSAQSEKGEMCEMRDDNVIVEHIDGSDTSKAGLHLESYVTPGIENFAHEDMANKRNEDSFSKLQGDLLDSGTTIDELASDKERGNIPIRSKYFKKQNGSEPELQQASASSTKLVTIDNKRTNTLPSNPASEKREFGSRSLESGSKFTGLSRSLPKMLSGDIPVQTENTEASHVKSLDNTRECLNADNIKPRNEPMVTTMAHEEAAVSSTKLISTGNKRTNTLPSNPALEKRNEPMVTTVVHDIMKEKPVSKGSDQNTEHVNAHRSDVHPSTSIEKLRKNISLNIINPGTSTHNMRKAVVKEVRISPTKAEMKASEVSTIRVSRATEPKLKSLTSLLPKSLTSMRNKDQSLEFQGNMVLKRNHSVDTKNQTPSTPTLKRKTFEESVDISQLTPLKRLSASPCRPSSEKVVKEQGCNHTSMAHDKSPRLDVSPTEIDISSSIENDGIFEMAEACSKELEDVKIWRVADAEVAPNLIVFSRSRSVCLLMLEDYEDFRSEHTRCCDKFSSFPNGFINKVSCCDLCVHWNASVSPVAGW